jgi:hypothetical protein
VELQIEGDVGAELAVDPPLFAVGDLPPHRATVVEAVLFSNLWDEIVVTDVSADGDRLTWSMEPADTDALTARNARGGHKVRIEVPAGLEHGAYRESLQISASPAQGSPISRTCSLDLRGRVLRRLAVYSDKIEFTGIIDLGVRNKGEGNHVRLFMKVRDEELDLKLRRIETWPKYVSAAVSPTDPEHPGNGTYYLDVELARDAPVCNHRLRDHGRVNLEFDHARIPRLDLKTSFAVMPDER